MIIELKEPHINTQTFKSALSSALPIMGTTVEYILEGINKYLLTLAREQIQIAFEQAEKKVADLHQRTREGMETARLNGKQIGQRKGARLITKKSKEAKETIRKYSADFGGALPDSDMIRLTGLSRNTYYKYKLEIKAAGLNAPAAFLSHLRNPSI